MMIHGRSAALWVSLLAIGAAAPAQAAGSAVEQATVRKITKRVEPAYPPLARQARIAGKVKMILQVSADGKVQGVRVIGGHPILVEAAEAAVRQWRYQTAPEESFEVVAIDFVP